MKNWIAGIALVLCFLPGTVLRAETGKIIYSKAFPGSAPAYAAVLLEASGDGLYKEAVDDDTPAKFHLSGDDTRAIFTLAAKLDNFKRPLESGLKVAFMGTKIFRWEEDGKPPSETKFNYTLDENGKALLDWFERIVESEVHYFALERSIKFDRLGITKTLNELTVTWDRKRLVAVDQFLPMLDRIAKNESFLHMARERAAQLATEFRQKKASE